MPNKRKIIPYNPELKELAKELRRNMTLSEVLLWNELKQKQMMGFDFDRQRPIGNYIVDFYCKELSLAIEIDGDTHIYKYDYDDQRQKELEILGVFFLRFEDIEVKRNILNVLRVIEDWIDKNKPTPGPSQEGNRLKKNQREDIISVISVVIRSSVLPAASRTDWWVVNSILPSIPRSVIMLTAKHGIFICRAIITSGVVDIPTASAPMILKYLYSAGVSKVGPLVER